ncbi:uncharacterized [Tachysurus ichikawai]
MPVPAIVQAHKEKFEKHSKEVDKAFDQLDHLRMLGQLLHLKLKRTVWSALLNEKTSIQMRRMYKMMFQNIKILNMEIGWSCATSRGTATQY